MAIVLRSVKGSNLTASEVDGNFTDLDTRVDALETDPPVANGIANITQSGATATVILDDATEFPLTLPVATPRPTITTAVSTTTLTPSLAQASAYFRCSHASGCAVTIPDNDTVAFPVDTELHFVQRGAGAVTFLEGVTDAQINAPVGKSLATFGLGAVVTLKKVATDEWDAFGDLAEDVTA